MITKHYIYITLSVSPSKIFGVSFTQVSFPKAQISNIFATIRGNRSGVFIKNEVCIDT